MAHGSRVEEQISEFMPVLMAIQPTVVFDRNGN
jgi:hypothetical protein